MEDATPETPALETDSDDSRLSGGVKVLIGFGIVLFLGSSLFLFQVTDAPFREECKQRCHGYGMDYRVRAVRHEDPMQYPADCICIARTDKQWWEVWK